MVKEAIIQMKRDKDRLALHDSIYGALFFGVPNNGMDISSLIQMVKGQPNEALVHSLGKESQILRNQSRDFPKAMQESNLNARHLVDIYRHPATILLSASPSPP